MRRPSAPQVAVVALVVAYVAILGSLALRRHQNLKTNALDLGYTDQAIWNMLHGRPFRFSTYVDAAFRLDIPIEKMKQPDVLLGYHVEPILVLIAPLYLLLDGPEALLWLQTVGIALGAVPLYLLARHRFGTPEAGRSAEWLAAVFVAVYLLSPALQAANLSDFHAVALSPALLLAAFYLLETGHVWGFLACAVLAAMCKEEIGLLVATLGIWASLVRRRWWPGLAAFAFGAGWFLVCTEVIMPYFSGLESSAFLVRYGHLGDSLFDLARNVVVQPGTIIAWLRRPDVVSYVRDLWLSSGALALLYPATLIMALPAVAINALSSFAWMRSGGAHYSASIVPFLVISAVYGTDWLARRVQRLISPAAAAAPGAGEEKGRPYRAVCWMLAGMGLAVALAYHYRMGVSPPARRYRLEPLSDHARRAAPLIERVNGLAPEVPIAAGSNLYPHVGHRQQVYLFPTVSDAEYIFLDILGPPSPIGSGDQWQLVLELLEYGNFGVAASDDGFLLLERGLDEIRLSPGFSTAFEGGEPAPGGGIAADFGGRLRLEAMTRQVSPVVRPELVIDITTWWRALVPLEEDYRLVFFFWDRDGRLVRVQVEERAVHWYPTWQWAVGQTVQVTLPSLPLGDLPIAGVAVLTQSAEAAEVAGRLAPITAPGGQALPLRDEGTILELWSPAWKTP